MPRWDAHDRRKRETTVKEYTSEELRAVTYSDKAAFKEMHKFFFKSETDGENLRKLHELLPEIKELGERFIAAFEAGEDLYEISELIKQSSPMVLVGVWQYCSEPGGE